MVPFIGTSYIRKKIAVTVGESTVGVLTVGASTVGVLPVEAMLLSLATNQELIEEAAC